MRRGASSTVPCEHAPWENMRHRHALPTMRARKPGENQGGRGSKKMVLTKMCVHFREVVDRAEHILAHEGIGVVVLNGDA